MRLATPPTKNPVPRLLSKPLSTPLQPLLSLTSPRRRNHVPSFNASYPSLLPRSESPTTDTASSPHAWELERKLTINPYPTNLTRLRTLIGLYANTIEEYRAALPKPMIERALNAAATTTTVRQGAGGRSRMQASQTNDHLDYVVGVARRKMVLEEALRAKEDRDRFEALMGRALREYEFIP